MPDFPKYPAFFIGAKRCPKEKPALVVYCGIWRQNPGPFLPFKGFNLRLMPCSFGEFAQCVSVFNLIYFPGVQEDFNRLIILDDLLNGVFLGKRRDGNQKTEYGSHQVSHDLKYSPIPGVE